MQGEARKVVATEQPRKRLTLTWGAWRQRRAKRGDCKRERVVGRSVSQGLSTAHILRGEITGSLDRRLSGELCTRVTRAQKRRDPAENEAILWWGARDSVGNLEKAARPVWHALAPQNRKGDRGPKCDGQDSSRTACGRASWAQTRFAPRAGSAKTWAVEAAASQHTACANVAWRPLTPYTQAVAPRHREG